jgi:hypothetical protein
LSAVQAYRHDPEPIHTHSGISATKQAMTPATLRA